MREFHVFENCSWLLHPNLREVVGGCLSFMSSIGALVDLSFGTGVAWVTPPSLLPYPAKRDGGRRVTGI